MQIRYSKIFIIQNDIPSANEAVFDRTENVHEYIEAITTELTNNSVTRQYCFDEQYQTAKNDVIFIISKINSLCSIPNEDERHAEIDEGLKTYIESRPAQRLSSIEKEFNDNHTQLNPIPKGVLIVAEIINEEGNCKLILAKADYAEFMEELSGDKKLGLPTKKKIYKSVSIEYVYDNHEYTISNVLVCDTSSRDAKYGWRSFLELKELRTNELNTINAYKAIKDKVISPIRKDHKTDFINLFNFNLAYFSSNDNFNIDEYIQKIRDYIPVDHNLNKESLINKLNTLPETEKFDRTFQKQPTSISDRMRRQVVRLADNLDLSIKGQIENLQNVIKAELDDQGNKIVVIYSDEGYEHFIRNQQ